MKRSKSRKMFSSHKLVKFWLKKMKKIIYFVCQKQRDNKPLFIQVSSPLFNAPWFLLADEWAIFLGCALWHIYATVHGRFFTDKKMRAQKNWQLFDFKWITVFALNFVLITMNIDQQIKIVSENSTSYTNKKCLFRSLFRFS